MPEAMNADSMAEIIGVVVSPPSSSDPVLERAASIIASARTGHAVRPVVRTFFDEVTFTASHVVHDRGTGKAAIVDSVLDFDPAAGRTSHISAQKIADYIHAEGLRVDWLIETHAHADHLSAAVWLQQQVGGEIVIGREIVAVQRLFGEIFNEDSEFKRDGSQFDRLVDDGDSFKLGDIDVVVMHVPGHTPADMAYVMGDAVFTGDTIFMPDYGTARADFPGGDAHHLYRSIRRLLSLPADTRLFLCHDYKAPARDHFLWETTVGAERTGNVHVHDGVDEEAFVAMRIARDTTLDMPRLILPSVQVNMRGGQLPPPESNGTRYLKLPLDVL